MGVLIFIFVFVSLVLFPLGQIARFDLGKGAAITGLDVGICALFLGLLFLVLIKKAKQAPQFLLPLIFFIAIGTISILVNFHNLLPYQMGIAFLYGLRVGMYVCIAWLVSSFSQSLKKKIPLILFFSGLIILIGGYIQYFLYPGLRNLLYEGWDEHFYRMFSSFFDPNFLGIFLVLYTLLTLYFAFSTKQLLWRCFFSLTIFISIVALFLTYSRNSYIVFFVSLILFLLLHGMKKWIIGLVCISFILLSIGLVVFAHHSEGTNLLRSVSTISRVQSLRGAVTIFSEHPVLGVGFDAYRYAQRGMGYLPGDQWEQGHNGAGVNDSFLLVLATTGIIGFSLFLWFLYIIIKQDWIETKKSPLGVLLLTSFITILLGSFFENAFFYPSLLFWVMVLQGVVY